ncbi:MAG: glycosyltransferase, partial [Nitrospinae bacterium]|nr:glycosyltransferase [Nitrospinota bacterium]
MTDRKPGLFIALLNIHGLLRGHSLELGRDADTGGQTKYVLELARALGDHPKVGSVEIWTRQIDDPSLAEEYGQHREQVTPTVDIVRFRCGPRRYIRKESLWPHLDSFADEIFRHLRRVRRAPDLIHAHYADAGFVGSRLASLLGAPLAFTGHSLGRVKRQRLLDQGMAQAEIEQRYHMGRRIDAEERALDNAAFVVASTRQEVAEQYQIYHHYEPNRMLVIPPGVDLSRFSPPPRFFDPPAAGALAPFLRNPSRPMILAIS